MGVQSPAQTHPIFSHEKLDVYTATLDFVALAHRMIRGFPRGHATLADQLTRAATSIALNTAEASGEFSSKEKARIYRIALRSVAECSAIVDISERQEIITAARHEESKQLLGRVAAMLTAMIHQQEAR